MTTEEPEAASEKLEALQRFVLNNEDLEQLEALLEDFNPFAALRWTRQEIRHSLFLRWLLDPAETHGLDAYFLRNFLKFLADRADRVGLEAPTVIDVDSWDYGQVQVHAEWNNIDIFIRDDANQFVAVIENKLHSVEHTNQLRRYRELVESRFSGYERVYVYLTIEGDAPSDDAYLSVTYEEIANLVSDVHRRRGDQLSSDVEQFIQHYVDTLRRHIVEDSKIQAICRRIYETHRRALDVLFEHRPDRVQEISEFLQELVVQTPGLIPDHSTRSYIRLLPEELDFLPKVGEGWKPSDRILLFEFDQSAERLKFKVVLGPGDSGIRECIRDHVRKFDHVFNRASSKYYPQWWSIHIDQWISKRRYEDEDIAALQESIRERFRRWYEQERESMIGALSGLQETDWQGRADDWTGVGSGESATNEA